MRDPTNRTRILVRWTRESGENPGHGKNLLSRQEQEKDRIWKVAVFLKDCFHARQILRAMKIGHWKSCHGSERRLKQCVCARRILRTWMDKSEDLQTTETKETCVKKRRAFRHTRHKGDGWTIIVFLIAKSFFSSFTGRCRRLTSPDGAKEIYRYEEEAWTRANWKNASTRGAECSKKQVWKMLPLLFGETVRKTGKTRAA